MCAPLSIWDSAESGCALAYRCSASRWRASSTVSVSRSNPNVSIRVLPFVAGAHRALGVGFTFVRLETPAITRVYIEGLTDATYIHEADETDAYEQGFEQLWKTALDERDSATMIRRRIGTE